MVWLKYHKENMQKASFKQQYSKIKSGSLKN